MLSDYVGQQDIIDAIIPIMHSSPSYSILLKGHYGFGKTELAVRLACIFGNYTYTIAPELAIDKDKINIIDEIHLIKKLESFYDLMVDHKFIFVTNMSSKLSDPFINRLYTFTLREYSLEELTDIIAMALALPEKVAAVFADKSRGIPRTGILYAEKFLFYCDYNDIDPTYESAIIYMRSLGINPRGLTDRDELLIGYLEKYGVASKATLSKLLGISLEEYDIIERYLIKLGIIRIGMSGRELNHEEF